MVRNKLGRLERAAGCLCNDCQRMRGRVATSPRKGFGQATRRSRGLRASSPRVASDTSLSTLRVQDLVALGPRCNQLIREHGPPFDRVVGLLLELRKQLFDPVPLLG